MRTEALERAKAVFDLLDADGNGLLEAADFELVGSRVADAAPDATDAEKNAVRQALREYWNALARELDVNHDNKVSFEEYTACVLSPERFDDTLDTFATTFAVLSDPDGDGLVERPLFVDLVQAVGFELENIHQLFDALEPDAEDRVSAAVWATAIKDYYGPEKSGVAGDHLVPAGTA